MAPDLLGSAGSSVGSIGGRVGSASSGVGGASGGSRCGGGGSSSGLCSGGVGSSASGVGTGGKVAPKYRDPATGQTWTGRGKAPKWIDGKDRSNSLFG